MVPQVFKREFGYLSTFSFAVSISGLFATTSTTFIYPLEAGGSASVVWCWLISGAGCMCIACSVAELVSAYPTCGGLYYTVSRLAPTEWVPSIRVVLRQIFCYSTPLAISNDPFEPGTIEGLFLV